MKTTSRVLLISLGLFLIDMISVPVGYYSSVPEVRGQTESGEGAGKTDYITDDGIVHFQSHTDLIELVTAMSEIKGEAYVIDGSVPPKDISIITPEGGMKKEDAIVFFDTVLRMNGLAVVKADGVNKVVNSSGVKGESTPVETDKQN